MVTELNRMVGCLFCGNPGGRFESEEHAIPYSLGNASSAGLVQAEIVVPPGEICDKCNRRRLSRVDQALINWPPISVFHTLALIENRKGRLTNAVDGTHWEFEHNPHEPRLGIMHVTANMSGDSRRDDVARALCKIAVETRWLTHPDDARSARWNEVAAAAIGGPLPTGLTMALLRGPIELANRTPSCVVKVGPAPNRLGMMCDVRVVGLRLLLLLRAQTDQSVGGDWWTVDPSTGRLQGPEEMALVFGIAASAAKRLAPTDSKPRGRASQLPTGSKGKRIYVMRNQADR